MRQKYTTEKLFPIRCFTFQEPDDLVEETLEKTTELEFHIWNEPEGIGPTNDIQTLADFVTMDAWFQHCVHT